ncbi:hypothetical protein MHYP_G00231630 [Metynnis hypsauchen]
MELHVLRATSLHKQTGGASGQSAAIDVIRSVFHGNPGETANEREAPTKGGAVRLRKGGAQNEVDSIVNEHVNRTDRFFEQNRFRRTDSFTVSVVGQREWSRSYGVGRCLGIFSKCSSEDDTSTYINPGKPWRIERLSSFFTLYYASDQATSNLSRDP